MSSNETKNPDDIICGCTGTSKEKIKQLIQSGKSDIEAITSATGATTGCGSCDVIIVNYIKQQKEPPSS
ncbi:MAG: (2Fe-2S)-binding protein [Methyloprofundus sp.]|nr:(2Fe-2S)-binding protein [Methyloprofundus sp.]